MYVITESMITEFDENGVICLRNAFSADWLKKVEEGISINLQNPSRYSEGLKAPGGEGYYFNDYCNWQTIAPFREFVCNSGIAEMAGRLMQSKTAVFHHDHVLTKDPGTSKLTPWHHDQAYYPIDGMQNCSVWLPVDPVDEGATIQFVPGSHRWGRWFTPRKFATERNYKIEEENTFGKVYEDVPDIDNDPDKYEISKWAVMPGDCVVFHMLTLHSAPANMAATPRRVLSTRWVGDDCVLARRPWRVSPPVTGGLAPGDSYARADSAVFPVLWRSERPQ